MARAHEAQTNNIASLESSRAKLSIGLARKLKTDLAHLENELNALVAPELRVGHGTCTDCGSTHMSALECLVQMESYERQSQAVAGRLGDLSQSKRKLDEVLRTVQQLE